jgi:ABC-type multidrug transport system permease subunit
MFQEMLTYPLSRSSYLLGKVLFNILVAIGQAIVTTLLAAALLGVRLNPGGLPLLVAAVTIGTAGWFFFYAIFALRLKRNDAFNTVTSVFYFVFLFASSMFYPVEPLPQAFRIAALLNPITWQVDVLRFATIGYGSAAAIAVEGMAFIVFSIVSFGLAQRALWKQE